MIGKREREKGGRDRQTDRQTDRQRQRDKERCKLVGALGPVNHKGLRQG